MVPTYFETFSATIVCSSKLSTLCFHLNLFLKTYPCALAGNMLFTNCKWSYDSPRPLIGTYVDTCSECLDMQGIYKYKQNLHWIFYGSKYLLSRVFSPSRIHNKQPMVAPLSTISIWIKIFKVWLKKLYGLKSNLQHKSATHSFHLVCLIWVCHGRPTPKSLD